MTSLEIQAFLTVQQTLSISRAAEQLYISQSSLSSRLQTLEQEYRGEYENEESASWSVEFYPSGGEQRIVEVLLPNIS